ncbi:7TM-DISM domain-containing protein [Pseudobacteriovorax antillogorgiicola]|uniref:7TMR-DISM extracellular 2 n=1 Tax=Pseudobacteriovorax antillogorgiicola TaxID=1513793 RepID=A0A1Y6BE78_9BACT|nr:7TM-DISM domain-containing protein [Pseudobacteriovorax antillogorgiicola]TCS56478.1 7TMR-DISM extracellular protein 2 [Pseudobacteriovorax antillogorgiicola]SMF04963.1 7TMR-DISM extracellular 2 [Pseudobacteriovorax antillogorgiicola]
MNRVVAVLVLVASHFMNASPVVIKGQQSKNLESYLILLEDQTSDLSPQEALTKFHFGEGQYYENMDRRLATRDKTEWALIQLVNDSGALQTAFLEFRFAQSSSVAFFVVQGGKVLATSSGQGAALSQDSQTLPYRYPVLSWGLKKGMNQVLVRMQSSGVLSLPLHLEWDRSRYLWRWWYGLGLLIPLTLVVWLYAGMIHALLHPLKKMVLFLYGTFIVLFFSNQLVASGLVSWHWPAYDGQWLLTYGYLISGVLSQVALFFAMSHVIGLRSSLGPVILKWILLVSSAFIIISASTGGKPWLILVYYANSALWGVLILWQSLLSAWRREPLGIAFVLSWVPGLVILGISGVFWIIQSSMPSLVIFWVGLCHISIFFSYLIIKHRRPLQIQQEPAWKHLKPKLR